VLADHLLRHRAQVGPGFAWPFDKPAGPVLGEP